MTNAEILAELTADPASIGYAAHIAIRDDGGTADLLNARTGPGAGTITMDLLSRDQMLLGLIPAILALGTASSEVQGQWNPVLEILKASDWIALTPTILGILQGVVTAGLLTQEQLTAFTTRPCSRAETLWGINSSVPVGSVSAALNSQGAQ